MQLIFPRFTGSALVNFARQVADILDLKTVTIDDTTDGRAGFGEASITLPKFTFEAQDGTKAEVMPAAPGSELNALLSSRHVLVELDRARKQAVAQAPEKASEVQSRPFKRDEALRILDRLRNEVGGIKARFPVGFEPEDANVHGEILFNDKSTIEISFTNSWPLTPQGLLELIDITKGTPRKRPMETPVDDSRRVAEPPAQDPKPQPQS